jgi:hypothetical protein
LLMANFGHHLCQAHVRLGRHVGGGVRAGMPLFDAISIMSVMVVNVFCL